LENTTGKSKILVRPLR